jgi:hypothetical protein
MRAAAQRGSGMRSMAFGNEPFMGGTTPMAAARPAIPAPALPWHGKSCRSPAAERFLAADLFGEPTWDILLDLFIAAAETRRVPRPVHARGQRPAHNGAALAAHPGSAGPGEREDDGRDGRRTFVCLTARGQAAMIDLMLNWQAGKGPVAQATQAGDAAEPSRGSRPCLDLVVD